MIFTSDLGLRRPFIALLNPRPAKRTQLAHKKANIVGIDAITYHQQFDDGIGQHLLQPWFLAPHRFPLHRGLSEWKAAQAEVAHIAIENNSQ